MYIFVQSQLCLLWPLCQEVRHGPFKDISYSLYRATQVLKLDVPATLHPDRGQLLGPFALPIYGQMGQQNTTLRRGHWGSRPRILGGAGSADGKCQGRDCITEARGLGEGQLANGWPGVTLHLSGSEPGEDSKFLYFP